MRLYHSAQGRLAVNFNALQLPITEDQALTILCTLGFQVLIISAVDQARSLIGRALYRRGARPEQAPGVVDCSSMTKWAYGQTGIWLPRYSIDQYSAGQSVKKLRTGDLVFMSGFRNYYWDTPKTGIGHVGIATENNTIIHAKNSQRGVIEEPLEDFLSSPKFRGIRRYLPIKHKVHTLSLPANRQVETSLELRWIILQHM